MTDLQFAQTLRRVFAALGSLNDIEMSDTLKRIAGDEESAIVSYTYERAPATGPLSESVSQTRLSPQSFGSINGDCGHTSGLSYLQEIVLTFMHMDLLLLIKLLFHLLML